MIKRSFKSMPHLRLIVLALVVLTALLTFGGRTAHAQACAAVNNLLMQGVAAPDIAQALGVTVRDVEVCQQILRGQAVGPPPFGAAGAPPLGAAGRPPLGAAGAPPVGAAGPPAMNKARH
jgi:hypothetical protein